MFKTLADINVDTLKRDYDRLYYFGLGFIQLKINEKWRLHFYSPELPAITEDIHNHRYDFTSHVLKGEITNNLYRVAPGHDYFQVNESCNPDIKAPANKELVTVEMCSSAVYKEGGSYQMMNSWFHTVSATNCITLLERSDYKSEFAQIIYPVFKVAVCPFSKKIPENQLWEIIAAML